MKATKKCHSKVFNYSTMKRGVAVLIAVVVVGAGTAFAFFSGIADSFHAGVSDDLRAVLVETDMANEPFYMLLLGNDGSLARDNDSEYAGQ